MNLREIVLSATDKEATAVPFWGVAVDGPGGVRLVSNGIWFNREDATRFFEAHRYRYSKMAFIYCFSGHESWHLKELYAIAKAETEVGE